MPVRHSAGPAQLEFEPDGGRITSLRVDGVELLLPVADALVGGAYVMAPYAGRIRRGRFEFDGVEHALPITLPPHAIHGTARYQTWSAVGDAWEAPLTPGWPFHGRVQQRFGLAPDRLDLELVVIAEERMPVSLGWHPWFRRGTLRVQPTRMYRRDADGIPSGTLSPVPAGPWDDCFLLDGTPETTIDGVRVRMESDAAVWVIYDQRADSICVEPQTAPPDAVNLGSARVLEAGEQLRLGVVVRWG